MIEEALTPLSILIVEDQPDTAETLAALLSLYGHKVRIAPCAREAYREVINDPPDVALLDIGLPGMDGWDLAAWLKTVSKPPVLIAITGYGHQDDYQRSVDAGIDLHLVKPVDPALLVELLKGYVRTLVRKKQSGSQ
jgi:DNA-binding response OmpR family regulator